MDTETLGNNPIMLQAFANGIVKGEFNENQIKMAANKIGLDKASAILKLVTNIGNGSGEKEVLSNPEYEILGESITPIYKDLVGYKEQADTVESNDKASIDDFATPLIGAGTIGGIYGLKKGIGKVRDLIPISGVKARDTANRIRAKTLGNYAENPSVGDKRVNDFVEYIQQFSKKDLEEVSRKGNRGVFDRIQQDSQKLNSMKHEILNNHSDKLLGREDILGDLDKEVEKLKKTNPSRAKNLAKVSQEYHQLFDNEAENIISELEKQGKFKGVSEKQKLNAIDIIKRNIKLPLQQIEGIKEGAYTNYDNFDQKIGANVADIARGEGYRIVGKSAKKALENVTEPALKEINSQYGKLQSVKKGFGVAANKAMTKETYSLGRKIGGLAGEAVSKLPIIKSSWFPKLTELAKEEKQLPVILERIRKRGDKIKISKPELQAIDSVMPEVNSILKPISKISKFAGKVPGLKAVPYVGAALTALDAASELVPGVNASESQGTAPIQQQVMNINNPKQGTRSDERAVTNKEKTKQLGGTVNTIEPKGIELPKQSTISESNMTAKPIKFNRVLDTIPKDNTTSVGRSIVRATGVDDIIGAAERLVNQGNKQLNKLGVKLKNIFGKKQPEQTNTKIK